MRLPHAELAEVNPTKIGAYLLSETHSVGRSRWGSFGEPAWMSQRPISSPGGLLQIARTQEVVESSATVHGLKCVLEGELEAPRGRRLGLRTIWIVDGGQERPRLVTAYPAARERRP